jgi:hypothetical protein
VLTESTYKSLSGVRGNSHAPFLGGGGAAMCRCYPTRQTGQHCSSQNQSRKKKRIITGKVMSFLTTGHKQRRRRRRTGAAGARSSPFPKGNGLPGSLVVHARTMPARGKGPPANQQPLYKGASVVRPASVLKRRACARLQVATYRIRKP